ncbi:unnamed protein product [Menidia menidia]|uniref:(Atlantic silverside) hypothetical protein n=1 Tax=Menidia menidia TaxID=238744 RepID=A0A8S4AKD3_9TELE|nr:unnamed protein product [Menidia menidia]
MLREGSTDYQNSSQFQIDAYDPFEDKSFLDVDASLKASFQSGLIEVEGSAKYLNNMKQSTSHGRVTCEYKATTVFKQLVAAEALKNLEITDNVKSLVTRVVTSILYGANTFYVFDSVKECHVGGKVEIHLSEEEKALVNKFTCKYYVDFILGSDPTNFNAVEAHMQLPHLLRENKDNGVPMKIWLMSLTVLDPEAANWETGVKLAKRSSMVCRKESPFNPEELKNWMDQIDGEVNVIESRVKMMEAAKLFQSQSELDREVLNPEADDISALSLRLWTDPLLQEMSYYLDSVSSPRAEDVFSPTHSALVVLGAHGGAYLGKPSVSSSIAAKFASRQYLDPSVILNS